MPSEPNPAPDRRMQCSWKHLAAFVALFTLLGPVLAGLVAVLGGSEGAFEAFRLLARSPLYVPVILVMAAIMAVVMGWLQGLIVGVAMAFRHCRTGGVSLGAAGLLGAATLVIPPDFAKPQEVARLLPPANLTLDYAVFAAAHILAAIACAALARYRFGSLRPSGGR